ncbi:RrF2 family transcriptional regulator [Sulfuricurvum sp.]|uniref:RrF2 family transcriptional regulator n=1 Tax=Sulfuricurvum sp. TaxID=2025608 RepID=UPI002633FFD1|nr:Rrf2 family transcriptional regulator [Sulfuricurvum sp.]MDD2266916.1 Rrf2 family transcriptional regulator [Sulfuricurvum sp.]MDD2783638.1 Rrf2 family transcriptional regulator [Sulfuricurvum sp.]HZF71323.1 Rrf2 family transcriptional regulator [Sulfuricurvum sp.]
MLSSACQDTIRAAVWLSTKPAGEFHRIQVISDALDLPFPFLAKSLQKLVHAHLLISQRGATGGVTLAREASEITLLSIIEAVDGTTFFDACVLGIGDCEAEKPCALHAQWDIWRQEMLEMYAAMRLSDITDDVTLRKVKRI